jgi:hypothetical protein
MSEAEAQARGYRAAKNGQVEVSKPVRTSPFCLERWWFRDPDCRIRVWLHGLRYESHLHPCIEETEQNSLDEATAEDSD